MALPNLLTQVELDRIRRELEQAKTEQNKLGNPQGPAMQAFPTGATRTDSANKLDPEGFNSPLVELRFAQYMHEHRKDTTQKSGLRASDNWQKGIPRENYMKSLQRHDLDLWLHHRGYGHLAQASLEDTLCAMRFNIDGYLFETLKSHLIERNAYLDCQRNMAQGANQQAINPPAHAQSSNVRDHSNPAG